MNPSQFRKMVCKLASSKSARGARTEIEFNRLSLKQQQLARWFGQPQKVYDADTRYFVLVKPTPGIELDDTIWRWMLKEKSLESIMFDSGGLIRVSLRK